MYSVDIEASKYANLNITGRNDQLSALAKDNNSFFYPAVSGSFILSEVLGLQNAKVNYVKLRAGWSKVGGTGPLGEYSTNRTLH